MKKLESMKCPSCGVHLSLFYLEQRAAPASIWLQLLLLFMVLSMIVVGGIFALFFFPDFMANILSFWWNTFAMLK